MIPLVNLYAVLGVEPGADVEIIRKAFLAIAKKYHPDATRGDKEREERFKHATNAYNVLSNPEQRAKYDAYVWPQEDPWKWDVDPTDVWGEAERCTVAGFRAARNTAAGKQSPEPPRQRGAAWHAWRARHSWFSPRVLKIKEQYRKRARGPEGAKARAWGRTQRPHHKPGPIEPQLTQSCAG